MLKKMRPYNGVRNNDEMPKDMNTRSLSLRLSSDGTPESLDEKARAVDVVCSTENPVEVFDYERWEIVPEVLLMSGCQIPASRQVPLLDTHYRGKVSSVLGSCRELQVEGDELIGRAHYSQADEESESAWQKTREGHLTDYSIGYRVFEAYYVPEGQRQTIAGRTFEGPVKVATQWKVRELSTCPIGADEMAKARAATSGQEHKSPQTEENDMNKRLRKFLESRGLATTATVEEAWRFLGTLDIREDGKLPEGLTEADLVRETPATGLTEADVERKAKEMARAEIERQGEIRSMCDHYGYGDMARELIDGNKTLDEARAAVMDKHMKDAPEPAVRGTVVGIDERDKFRAAGQDALILRAGLKAPEQLAAGADDLRGYGLVELARESLRMAGQPIGGDPMQMVGRALTSSDFPILLGDTANLAMLEGFETAEENWETFADGSGSVSDFKTQTLARAGESDDLDEIGEDDEYKYGKQSEQSESFKLATYGKLNKISRQAIINDELGEIVAAFSARGEAASRKVGDIVYAVLTANSAMGDGTALFHATHNNLGAAAALSATTAAEAIKKMKLQKDINGKRRLNIPARFFLAPAALEGTSEIFFGSQLLDVASGSQQQNPYAGTKFNRVYDARLDDDSATAYYFLGPKGKTIKVFFLNGNRVPFLETREGWTVDGIEYKTRIDAAAKALSWKGMVKNAGS